MISDGFITLLEEKLENYSEFLSRIQDKDLRNLLEFLFYYVVEKPTTTPRNGTIMKHFDLSSEDKPLIDSIRAFLYGIRLMLEISNDKESIEQVHKFS